MARVSNLTANGSTPWTRLTTGKGIIAAGNDFGGGTVAVEILTPAGATRVIGALSATAGALALDFPCAVDVRATLASATSPDLDVEVWGG